MESEKDDLILALEELEFALEKAEQRSINVDKEINKLRVDNLKTREALPA